MRENSPLFEIALVRFDHVAHLVYTRITASCERLLNFAAMKLDVL